MRQTGKDIQQRTFDFAVRIMKLTRALPRDMVGQTIGRQVVRLGTGIGANIEEAQGAQTKREFAPKMNIARGEALKTRYWLRLMVAGGLLPEARLQELINESDQLVRILVTIVKNARRGDESASAK